MDEAYESDAELAAGLGRGEPEAEVHFARRFGPVIDALLQNFRIGAGDRDGIVVRVAAKVVRQAVIHPISDLGKYTVTAALNAGRDFLRLRGNSRQEDWQRVERLERMGPRRQPSASPRTRVDHEMLREIQAVTRDREAGSNEEALKLVHEALARLSEGDRRILLLRADGFRDEEIACYLEEEKPISREVVRKRHSRALKRFCTAVQAILRERPTKVRRELERYGILEIDS